MKIVFVTATFLASLSGQSTYAGCKIEAPGVTLELPDNHELSWSISEGRQKRIEIELADGVQCQFLDYPFESTAEKSQLEVFHNWVDERYITSRSAMTERAESGAFSRFTDEIRDKGIVAKYIEVNRPGILYDLHGFYYFEDWHQAYMFCRAVPPRDQWRDTFWEFARSVYLTSDLEDCPQ